MSILQDISKRLLAVASMPPEKRNDALMEVKIEIEGVQYDMVLEQKDLIMNIIDELIAENDADQIAKSKLVFVPDVEEQIAPTKKTRAKKVVAPVVEVESEDLPDFIEKVIPIIQLPEPIIKLAGFRRKLIGVNGAIDVNGLLSGAFNWNASPEGYGFWDKITNLGDLRQFKELYGNKGEKVDEIIEFAELNEFVEGLSKPVSSGDLPDTIPSGSLIKNFPEPIKKLALKRQFEAGNNKNEDVSLLAPKSFNWAITPEGGKFWSKIVDGDLTEFKRIFGNDGESVDNLVNGLVGFNELLEFANKQNAPAPAVASGDLPDFIDSEIMIKDLPEQVRKLALQRQKDAGNNPNENLFLGVDKSEGNFDWDETPEGDTFWEIIYAEGDLTEFKRIFGNKGEKVDAIINPAPAVKTRKPRTPKVAPVVAPVVTTQKLLYLTLIFNPPVGSAIKLKVFNPEELHYAVIGILNKLDVVSLFFNFEAVTDFSSYLTKEKLYYHYEPKDMVDKLVETFDTFVNPELDWSKFVDKVTDFTIIKLNELDIEDAFKKKTKVVAQKVVTPKVVTPKPVKVVAPKVVKTKVVKTKVTKPKVEDDLSFLNDLDNIF